MDATRTKDGVKVVLKCIAASSDELEIAKYLSSAKMLSDPRNRTVPIIEVIPLPDNQKVFLVMPYLRVFNTPPFHCRGEFVEALRQFMQVCQFRPMLVKNLYSPFTPRAWNSCMKTIYRTGI